MSISELEVVSSLNFDFVLQISYFDLMLIIFSEDLLDLSL